MADRTARFGFLTFDNDQDDLSMRNYQAFGSDRELMDRLLRIAVEAHTHTGVTMSEAPPSPPLLELATTGGSIAPNQPVFYRTTKVDADGQEHVASQTAVVYTPVQIGTPAAPTVIMSTLGSLAPGDYQYVLSAWAGSNTAETAISHITTASLRGPGTGAIAVQPPTPPSGADGWNLYRKGPTETGFYHLASTTIGNSFLDGGTTARSSSRRAPTENSTFLTSSVAVDRDTALASGETLRIYRTYDSSDWDGSLIAWTDTLPFVDQGFPGQAGYPPDVASGVGGAPRIRLGADVEGTLPPGLATPTTTAVFNVRGDLAIGYTPWPWVNEPDVCHLLGMRANLGRGSTPDSQPVQVRLDLRRFGELTWAPLHDTETNLDVIAEIPVGESIGDAITFPATTSPDLSVQPGDALRVSILQTGGGAVPTDRDLSVVVTAAVQHGPIDESDLWSV